MAIQATISAELPGIDWLNLNASGQNNTNLWITDNQILDLLNVHTFCMCQTAAGFFQLYAAAVFACLVGIWRITPRNLGRTLLTNHLGRFHAIKPRCNNQPADVQQLYVSGILIWFSWRGWIINYHAFVICDAKCERTVIREYDFSGCGRTTPTLYDIKI